MNMQIGVCNETAGTGGGGFCRPSCPARLVKGVSTKTISKGFMVKEAEK